MDNASRLQLLFEKYLQRRCSPNELKELIGLLQQAEADDNLSTDMQELWDQLKADTTSYDVDWENMYDSIRAAKELQPASRRRYGYAIAASILFVFAMAAWWMNRQDQEPPAAPIVERATPKIQSTMRQTIHLPDGSTVILNANSRLNYPPVFSGAAREVFLSGEGYFDIKHNPDQPFLVHTGRITTKVLGTAFNIKAYAGDENVEVTVTRGKVQVLKDNQSLGLITASQQIAYSNKAATFEQKMVDVKPVIAWKPQEIYFNDITMEEALQQITERFHMEVLFNNPAVKQCRVTATFSGDDLPDEMLAVICAVSKANYTINDIKITIDGKGCNH
jgi:ferric-dicitrate binding protein FerR (iron transport regulator)